MTLMSCQLQVREGMQGADLNEKVLHMGAFPLVEAGAGAAGEELHLLLRVQLLEGRLPQEVLCTRREQAREQH